MFIHLSDLLIFQSNTFLRLSYSVWFYDENIWIYFYIFLFALAIANVTLALSTNFLSFLSCF